MLNVKESMYNKNRCYIYNKAFVRYFDNNNPNQTTLADAHWKDQYNGKTRAGALAPTGVRQEKCVDCDCGKQSHFDLIREWASERGLYKHGDPKTQLLKLVEEVGETCRAVLKENKEDAVDGIGDCVVVLTNLAELLDVRIEDCVGYAYDEIKNRKGNMANGTYVKND